MKPSAEAAASARRAARSPALDVIAKVANLAEIVAGFRAPVLKTSAPREKPPATTRAEIEAEFEGVRDPAVLKGLARLCDTFRVTAEELSAEWDIVELNAATSRALSLDALADLEGQVKASQAKKKARQLAKETKAQHTTRAPPPSTFTKDSAHLLRAARSAPSRSTPGGRVRGACDPDDAGDRRLAGTTFASRTDSGKVMATLHGELGAARGILPGVSTASSAAAVTYLGDGPANPGPSYMWEKMEDRARLLDEQVAALEAELTNAVEAGSLELPPFAPVFAASPEEVTIVGRICAEGDGKINAYSAFIEGSRGFSNGCRARLDLTRCDDYAIFPGAVVAAGARHAARPAPPPHHRARLRVRACACALPPPRGRRVLDHVFSRRASSPARRAARPAAARGDEPCVCSRGGPFSCSTISRTRRSTRCSRRRRKVPAASSSSAVRRREPPR